jgi:hypothetical protein
MIKIINAHAIFTENAICLSKRTGWVIEKDLNPQPDDLYVVFGAHEIAHKLIQLETTFQEAKPLKFIIMNSEQEQSQFLKNKYYLELMKKNVVINFTADTFLEKYGIRSLATYAFEFINFERGFCSPTTEGQRPYDYTFIGSYTERREQIINELKEKYPDKTFFIDFEWKHKEIETLTKILHQSKCVLNIPYYENSSLETHRINKALSCGCDVISFTKPHEDYLNYVTFKEDVSSLDLLIPNGVSKGVALIKLNEKYLPKVVWIIEQIYKMKCKDGALEGF